jgi:phosphohistidine phosphatase SixA
VVKLYLVRHAQAGDRSAWDQPDALRPLSPRGARQAAAIGDLLTGSGVKRLLSSPAVRCVDTLRPLGEAIGLEVTSDDRLAEGAGADGVLDLIAEVGTAPAALCSHGDVIPDLLDLLVQRGLRPDDPLRWQKGSAWELEWDGRDVTGARYLPPPG